MKYLLLLALAVLQVVLSMVLLYKRHDRVSRTFNMFTAALLVWTLINIFLDYQTASFQVSGGNGGNTTLINMLNTFGFVVACIILLVLYKSVLAALNIKNSKIDQKVSILGLLVAIVSLLPQFSGHYAVKNNELHYAYGPLSVLVVPYFLLLSWLSIRAAVSKLKSNVNVIERQQAVTVLAGLLLSAAWGITFIIVTPFITKSDSTIFVGYLAPYIFTLLMFYGIIWLGFLNFRQLVARSIGYILSIIGLGGAFILLANLLVKYVLHVELTGAEVVGFTFVSFLVAVGFQPAKKFFDRLTNQIFYRDAYDPQELHDELNKLLVSSLDIKMVMGHSAQIIAKHLKPEYCLVGLKRVGSDFRLFGTHQIKFDPEVVAEVRRITPTQGRQVIIADMLGNDGGSRLKELMQQSNVAVLVRLTPNIREKKEGLGYIILGTKSSGGPYAGDDIRTLEAVANELVLAIQNILHFEEIQNFNATLQQQVDESTRKLRNTNDKLKKLDETKDEFISMASHQLRTPLTSVKGYLSMVLDGDAGKLNKQQTELLKQSFVSSQRMVGLIADLLNLSRLNTGKFVIEPIEVDLRTVVEGELAQLRETAKAKNISLIYRAPENLTKLMLDETKIHQVVMNFMDNAIYYTPSGGEVEMAIVETPEAIEFTVKDNGIGVPREQQPHLFTKFYRAENAKRARPDGTGLGIFMAKKVVAASGGSILFESEEGKGSKFGFRFNKVTQGSKR